MDRTRPGRASIVRLTLLVLAALLLAAMPGGVTGLHRSTPAAQLTLAARQPTTGTRAAEGAFRLPADRLTSAAATASASAGALGRVALALEAGQAASRRAERAERGWLDSMPALRSRALQVQERRERAEAEARARAEAERRRAEAEARAKAAAEERARREAARYSGRNHFWYPALGIDRPVDWFSCSRSRPPDSPVYRWGCAGSNNVYLLAHAWSWFKPLNRAYYAGTLAAGQVVAYADGNGRTHFYRLDWWKTWRPLPSARWAWASQSRSSLTLQTCVGANSELRLFVRFHEVAAP